jgi:hypothetical protein
VAAQKCKYQTIELKLLSINSYVEFDYKNDRDGRNRLIHDSKNYNARLASAGNGMKPRVVFRFMKTAQLCGGYMCSLPR